jgi:hypothetical protein
MTLIQEWQTFQGSVLQLTGNIFAYKEPNVIEVISDVGRHVLAFWRNMLPLSLG